jgi:LDH2 family malate/lactate/ureidoglycolate dehydrogenase
MNYMERNELERLCTSIFLALGLSEKDAAGSARILVAADARNIPSHGVARMWRYANGIKNGVMDPHAKVRKLRETPLSLVLDANGAMGLVVGLDTMETVVEQAKKHGIFLAAVKDSNHFGIAGYYAELAAKENLIGLAMTNTAALGVPTNGREAMFGTNPIAVSMPATDGRLFTLDMATTCVTRGKIETYQREGKPLPSGWAVDTEGRGTTDATKLLDDMLFQRGGGLLPLGGEGELFSGYKGYGLSTLVDIMTAVCSGGTFGKNVKDSKATSARVCHFFAAVDISLFRTVDDFKADLGRMLSDLEGAIPARGCARVFYAGQKEHEAEQRCAVEGVPLSDKVLAQLASIADELQVPMPRSRKS